MRELKESPYDHKKSLYRARETTIEKKYSTLPLSTYIF